MRKHIGLLLLLVAVLVPVHAFAWGTDGHRIVCAIAWDEMKPATRDKVEHLLALQDRDGFANLCNWADQYRGREHHQETAPWHYVTVPIGANAVDILRDCPGPQSCAILEIGRDALKLSDPKAPLDEQAMALKFLIHFVGDLHQPLHVSHWQDEGGSKIRGEFMGRKTNMHSIWDSGLIRNAGRPWGQIADELEAKITPAERRSWTASRPLDWANESLAIANDRRTGYVVSDEPFELGEDFERRELPVAYGCLSRAGVRLGALLNGALGR